MKMLETGVPKLYCLLKITGVCFWMKFCVFIVRGILLDSSFDVSSVEMEKQNGCQIFFFHLQPTCESSPAGNVLSWTRAI